MVAIAGVILIFEGIFPFLSPGGWKETFTRLTRLNDGQIRFFGLSSMLLGMIILLVF